MIPVTPVFTVAELADEFRVIAQCPVCGVVVSDRILTKGMKLPDIHKGSLEDYEAYMTHWETHRQEVK